jgi:hypothetical protein
MDGRRRPTQAISPRTLHMSPKNGHELRDNTKLPFAPLDRTIG